MSYTGLMIRQASSALLLLCSMGCQDARRPRPPPSGLVTTPSNEPVPAATAPSRGSADAAHGLLVSSDDCAAPSADAITLDDAIADFAVVEEVLRTGYAGYEVVVEDTERWEAAFATGRSELERLGPHVAVEAFRSMLIRTFRFTRDGHLAFWTVGPGGSKRRDTTRQRVDAFIAPGPWSTKAGKLHLGDEEVRECDGQDPTPLVRATFAGGRPGVAMVRLSETAPAPLSCRVRGASGEAERSVAFRPIRVSKPVWKNDEPVFSEVKTEVPILRVARLDSGQHEKMMAVVDEAKRLRDEPSVIVDLRGNGGGSDTYAREFVANLTSTPLRHAVIEELLTKTAYQGTINWATCVLDQPHIDAAARTSFEQKRSDFLDKLSAIGPDDRSWKVGTPEYEGKAPRPYRGTLVVLIDRGCGSACEDFVMFTRQLPTTVLVGENTAGVTEFGDVRPYRLPRSGIWMHASIKWFHDPDPKMVANEGYGHMPDIWLDGEDSLATAVDIARCLRTKECEARLRSMLARAAAASSGAPAARD